MALAVFPVKKLRGLRNDCHLEAIARRSYRSGSGKKWGT